MKGTMLMTPLTICLLSIFLLPHAFASSSSGETFPTRDLKVELAGFLSQFEKHAVSPSDVVFLLESSGFVDPSGFAQMKLLAGDIVRQFFRVSEDQDRIAVVSFSTEAVVSVNHVANGRGENLCSLLKEIDDVGYQGEYRFTYLAMEQARDILQEARTDSEKIVVILTNGLGMRGSRSFMLADELKSKGVAIFVIGFEDVSEKIAEMATSVDHSLMVGEFDEVSDIRNLLLQDSPKDFCGSACDKTARCQCDAPTGNVTCLCDAGHFTNPGSFECLKCRRGFFKSNPDDLHCMMCPPQATTLNEGSVSPDDCLCRPGYEKSGGVCAMCPKGTYKDRIGNTKCVRCPPHSFTYGMGSSDVSDCVCEQGYQRFGRLCVRWAPEQRKTPDRNDDDDDDDDVVSSSNFRDVTTKNYRVAVTAPTTSVTTAPTNLPDFPDPTRKDSNCAKIDYNALDEVDSSLPLLGKLIKSLPQNKRLPKIMELLNNVYGSVEKQ